MKTHNLKILPEHFDAVINGSKKAEFRINDRDFSVGDTICLCEHGSSEDWYGLEGFSGRYIWMEITHITDLSPWLSGYVMLSITQINSMGKYNG